jgi:glc operon protein GlcG
MKHYSRSIETLTLAGAQCVRDHALDQASALGLSIALVIIGRTGLLILAETMDNAPPGACETALMKAKSAARYLQPTHLTAEFVKTLPAQLAQHALGLEDLCAFQGGMPIKIGEEILGGLGISGGTGAQDIEIASRAAATIA